VRNQEHASGSAQTNRQRARDTVARQDRLQGTYLTAHHTLPHPLCEDAKLAKAIARGYASFALPRQGAAFAFRQLVSTDWMELVAASNSPRAPVGSPLG
jgi:hypothetical protein